jgi:ribosomal protein S18 acetylase RimI-like enzyme
MPLEIRPAVGYADLQRWVETCNATSNDTMTTQGRALVRAREIDSVDLLAVEDGKPVGVALLAGDPRSLALRQPWCDVRVLEEHRHRGVGSALLANLIACARSAGPVGLRCSADAEDADSLAFLSRRGFTVTRSIEEVSFELASSSPVDLQPPDGIELLRLADEPALVPAMYALASATAADRADRIGGVVPTETDWRAYELSSPLVRLDMTTVAIADGAAVGYSVLQDVPGHHGLLHYTLVVAPVWREQGLAHALVRKAMRDAVAEGVPRLTARPENQFEADVFASLGYRVRERRVEYGLTL